MLEFKGVYKSYNHPILVDFSFKLKDGENLGIFGKSGIGKTTIINLILGLEKPDQGFVKRDFKKASVVFQENRLIDEISALDNLKILTDDKKLAISVLNKFGVFDVDKSVNLFSGGMQRKVALARAYLFDGDILIMDEPFTGLDFNIKKDLARLIKQKFKDKSIIIVSHNLDDYKLFDIGNENIIFL